MPHILNLPTDIWLSFFRYISPRDVLNIRQTCKEFYLVSHLRGVWWVQLMSLVHQQDVPIPGLLDRPFHTLSTPQLQNLALKASQSRQNWSSQSPLPSNKHTIKVGPSLPSLAAHHSVAIILDFLPRIGHRYLISSSIQQSHDTTLHLQCWDLQTSTPNCIATRVINRCIAVSINKERHSPFALAIGSPESIELVDIDHTSIDPSRGFMTKARVPHTESRLVALHGSILVTRDEQNNLFVRDVTNPTVHLELHGSSKTSEKILEVLVEREVIVVARLTRLEIYPIREIGTSKAIIFPVAEHVWAWSLDSVSLAVQSSWIQRSATYAPLNILLRFGSRLPWPVNLLHHFILYPDFTFQHSKPITPNNLPYNAIPMLRHQIGSPVRLFSHYHMALGSRGTAVYIDSHTEDYFCRGDCGQRLAGSLSGTFDPDDENFVDDEDATRTEPKTGLSVFSYCENDGWNRVAVDEEEGRIALGCLDGTIMLYEYA